MRALALALLIGASGCGAWQPPNVEPFFAGDLAAAEQIFRQRLVEPDGDWVLMTCELATTLQEMGRVDEAWQLFYDAGRAMGYYTTTFGESLEAVAGREDSREFRGDPYEQALCSIYTGLLYWLRGEPDNARACFKEAMLRDASSSEERHKSDLALSYYLAAWASRQLGDASEARGFLDEAAQAQQLALSAGARGDLAPRCIRDFGGANVLFVASVGRGPEKIPGGDRGEMAVIVRCENAAAGFEVKDGEKSLGRGEILCDVWFQAGTRGGRWMDGVREGKAIFKSAAEIAAVALTTQAFSDEGHAAGWAVAGLAALLISLLIQPEADLRCWRTLPDTVQVIAASLPPGRRKLDVAFLGTGGVPLPDYHRQLQIDVPESGTLVLHLRSMPARKP